MLTLNFNLPLKQTLIVQTGSFTIVCGVQFFSKYSNLFNIFLLVWHPHIYHKLVDKGMGKLF